MRAKKTIGIALLAATTLSLNSCTGPLDVPDDQRSLKSRRTLIDAEKYFRDYESGESDSTSVGGSALSGTPGTASDEAHGVPGLLDDNTFVNAGTSDFVSVDQDPLSTFALDVDTGSYTVARTLMRRGLTPPPASIRPEEWVNAFDYADAAPTDTDFGMYVDQGPTATQPNLQTVRIGIRARDVLPVDRPPVHLTLVIDTSGSMDIRARLGLVKSSLALLAENLHADDTIAVVTYENQATPLLQPTPVRQTDTILAAIDELRPGGSTNLAAGLKLGYQQARSSFTEDAINAVVLASDGVANVGVTGPGSLVDTIGEAGAEGMHLVTVGYGMGNYNDNLMEKLADQGDGFYSYVDTFDEAERLFGSDLTSTLTVVARDAKAQVEFDPAAVSSYRLIGYDNRAISDDEFESDSVDAGEIGAGHEVTALYEVELARDVEPGDAIGEATVRWESVATGEIDEAVATLTAADPAGDGSEQLALSSTVADLAQFLKGAGPMAKRDVDLAQLAARAADLEEAGVEGAAELSGLIQLAQQTDRRQ